MALTFDMEVTLGRSDTDNITGILLLWCRFPDSDALVVSLMAWGYIYSVIGRRGRISLKLSVQRHLREVCSIMAGEAKHQQTGPAKRGRALAKSWKSYRHRMAIRRKTRHRKAGMYGIDADSGKPTPNFVQDYVGTHNRLAAGLSCRDD